MSPKRLVLFAAACGVLLPHNKGCSSGARASGQKDQSYPLTQSNDSLWPEGRKDQDRKKINALGHMHTRMDAVVKD